MASTELRAAAQQALEALEDMLGWQSLAPHTIQEAAKGRAAALRAELAEPVQEPDLSRCPKCGGHADNGHDRCVPPNPYHCTKCMAEPVQEPFCFHDGRNVVGKEFAHHEDVFPLYTAPPQRKPLSVTDLQDALVYANLIDRDAIDDPDNYDEGSTLAQIDALHRAICGITP